MAIDIVFRNKRLNLQEVAGLRAVAMADETALQDLPPTARSVGIAQARAMSFSPESAIARSAGVSGPLARFAEMAEDDDVAAFIQAGYAFVPDGGRGRSGRPQQPGTRHADTTHRVFTSDTGRVYMETPDFLVHFARGADLDREEVLLRLQDVVPVGRLAFANAIRCRAAPGADPFDLIARLRESGNPRAVEPVLLEHIGHRQIPNDPRFRYQWFHRNSQRPKADLGTPEAWEKATGKGIKVAVIDNGFHPRHPDLRRNVHAGSSGYFVEGLDGYPDFVAGLRGMPEEEHGTNCAGLVAAAANNGIGGCGVAFDAQLMLIATLADQIGSQATLARAIAYAADNRSERPDDKADGADVIVCSLGPNDANWTMTTGLEDALTFAGEAGRSGKGCPILWAVTNGNHPVAADEVVSHPSVLGVGRSTIDDGPDGSGYGPGLDMLAPGVRVLTTSGLGAEYRYVTGTSFAAPCAAGVAALVLEGEPHLTRAQVEQRLIASCERVGPGPFDGSGWNPTVGHGRISAARAV